MTTTQPGRIEGVDPTLACRGRLVRFFLSGLFSKQAARVEAIFDAWLGSVPASERPWAIVNASTTNRIAADKKALAKCRLAFSPKTKGIVSFQVGGPNDGVTTSSFNVLGRANDRPSVANGSVSVLSIRYPLAHDLDDIVRLAMRAAQTLDVASGFVTDAIFVEGGNYKGERLARRIALERSGLELDSDDVTGSPLPRWLTFLGPDLAASIGRTALRGLAAKGVPAEKVGAGILLRASAVPVIGKNARDIAPTLAAIGRVLLPHATGAQRAIKADLGYRDAADQLEDAIARGLELRYFVSGGPVDAAVTLVETERAIQREIEEGLPGPAAIRRVAKLLAALSHANAYLGLAAVMNELALARRADCMLALIEASPTLGLGLDFGAKVDGETVIALLDRVGARAQATTDPARRDALFGAAAGIGCALLKRQTNFAPRVGASLARHESTRRGWDVFLYTANNQLGELVYSGDLVRAETLGDDLQPFAPRNPEMYQWIATIYVKRKRLEDAVTQLELALQHGYDSRDSIRDDVDFAPLKRNARFVKFLRAAATTRQ